MTPKFRLEQLDHIALRVADMPRALRWYQDVLGLESRSGDVDGTEEPPIFLYCGDTALAFFPQAGGAAPASAHLPGVAMMHFAFRTDREGFERARGELEARGIETRFADHGNAHSIYIKDPDGYTVEITTYELQSSGPRRSDPSPRGPTRPPPGSAR